MDFRMVLDTLKTRPDLVEIGRLAVEDMLIDMRNSAISVTNRNGFAVHDKDGTPNGIIRLPIEIGVNIFLGAIAEHLE